MVPKSRSELDSISYHPTCVPPRISFMKLMFTSHCHVQLPHSCDPSARPFFNGTSELHLIATRPLKEGDQVTVAYVDITQRDDESVQDCRRRRRTELVRGWAFACTCSRCASEAGPSDEADIEPKDKSKVSEVVSRLEGV